MSDLIIGEPDVIRKEDNILWLRAEVERLTAQAERNRITIDIAYERCVKAEAELKQANAVVEAARKCTDPYELWDWLVALEKASD